MDPLKTTSILLSDFPAKLRWLAGKSERPVAFGEENSRFDEQFSDLAKVGSDPEQQREAFVYAQANEDRNRYGSMVYPAHRVRLLDVEKADGSDYINASPIELPFANNRAHPSAKYIAAMGPTKETSPHFLQMLWEQRAPAVVALTKCKEEGRKKCHEYWPTKKMTEKQIGKHFKVKLIGDEREEHGVTIRLVELWNTTHVVQSNQPSHRFLHFHYEHWPDHGLPQSPAHLVNFQRLFRAELRQASNHGVEASEKLPIVVHCSAGYARTGTFIAIDHLIEDIPREFGGDAEVGTEDDPNQLAAASVDVFSCVHEMRVIRPMMVGGEDEYVFIHLCLLYVVNGGNVEETEAIRQEAQRNRKWLSYDDE